MKTTKSLPILAVSIVAWMAAGPALSAADLPIYANYQSDGSQLAPEPLQTVPGEMPQSIDDCSCNDQSAYGGECCDTQYGDTSACANCDNARHPRLRGMVNGRHHRGHTTYRPNGVSAGLHHGMYDYQHSGHPWIDPHGRADYIAQRRAATQSWHAGYYHTQYGAPVALMVPPTARMQTRWGWGVSQSTMSPIYQQFERPYPGQVGSGQMGTGTGGGLLPTPRWPSHTDQFGVYYVRGPW